jgi:hypothetical protein
MASIAKCKRLPEGMAYYGSGMAIIFSPLAVKVPGISSASGPLPSRGVAPMWGRLDGGGFPC